MSTDAQPALEIVHLTKRYGQSVVVDDVSLAVTRGQLVALLGPSGCGKTTTLRMIAGLVEPSAGHIVLEGTAIDRLPIHRRNIGMVFQQYALFPHLSVFENIAYGLREQRQPQLEIHDRVAEMLRLVGLSGMEGRRIRQLSGGQQQRVALARALVIRPSLLLLDEPLSNLDTKLRERVRGEIRELQRRLGITTVFVTHDQDEALSTADVVVLMHAGRIEQIGTPLEIYQHPANTFVADFIGACNLVPAKVISVAGGTAQCSLPTHAIVSVDDSTLRPDEEVTLGIRPEHLDLLRDGHLNGRQTLSGVVRGVSYLGARTVYNVDINGLILRCDEMSDTQPLVPGTSVALSWDSGTWQAFR